MVLKMSKDMGTLISVLVTIAIFLIEPNSVRKQLEEQLNFRVKVLELLDRLVQNAEKDPSSKNPPMKTQEVESKTLERNSGGKLKKRPILIPAGIGDYKVLL